MGTQSQINIQKHPKTQALQKLSTLQTSNLHTRITKLLYHRLHGATPGEGQELWTNIYACSCPQKGEVGHMVDRCIMRWFWHLTTSLLCSCSAPAHGNLGSSVAILGASVQIGMSLCQLVLAMIHIVIEQPGYKANTHIDTTHIKHFMNWHTRLLHDG